MLQDAGAQDEATKSSGSGHVVPLSIVVPIYNVEAYLPRCLDSLLSTSGITSCEILLIDDGSTDGSGEIASTYAEKSENIFYFRKENGGLSDARNFGLRKATGKYVFFCDSDDMVKPEGFAKVIAAADVLDKDVLLWNGITINENDEEINTGLDIILTHAGLEKSNGSGVRGKGLPAVLSGTEAMVRQIRDHNKIAMTAWLRACRREFLLKNDLLFQTGLLHEDELWTPKVMTAASDIEFIPENVYCYRIRGNSIMSGRAGNTEKHAQDLTYILNTLYEHYRSHVDQKDRLKVLLGNWADTYLWVISSYGVGRYGYRKDVPRRKIAASCRRIRSRIKAWILLLGGVKLYCRICSF